MGSIGYKSERGASLVAVLVAVACLGIGALAFMNYASNQQKEQSLLARRYEKEEVRRYLRLRLDCPATIAALPSPCPAGQAVTAQGTGSPASVLIQSNATSSLGSGPSKLFLKASCTGTQKEFKIETRHGTEAWSPLFEVPFAC